MGDIRVDCYPHPSKETLTAWWIGINDTGDTVSNDTITDYAAFWDYEVSTYFEAVQTVIDQGLTQHLFVNVPPGDRSPLANTNATKAAILKERVEGFNVALDRHMALFSLKNPHAKIMTFDAHKFFSSVLDKPAEYGFTDVVGHVSTSTSWFLMFG
ncbi:hypothetical protein CPB85DRAFT_1430159 [Mucidula mucida]|nr:hypothetical protein CPB85DRAFT_1430159 [Mucidula mucida]